jgi:hypothetical protein
VDAYCVSMAASSESRVPPQLVGLATAGGVGAASAALTSVAMDLDHPAGYALFGALVAAACAAILARPIRAGRQLGWLALATATYAVGVLAFPLAGWTLGLETPGAGVSFVDSRSLLAMYLLAPAGFGMAAPFSPAVLATSLITTKVMRPEPATPRTDADRHFRRGTLVAASIVGVLSVGGFVMVLLAASSSGI